MYAFLEPQSAEHGNEGEGEKERSDEGDGDGVGHRLEEFRRRADERVDGKVSGDDDGDRVEDGAVDIFRGGKDDFLQVVVLAFALAKFAEDVFDHDERAVDEDAEIYGSDGKKISCGAARVKEDEGEQQRYWNGESDDNGRAHADEETHQDDENEHHSQHHVVLDRVDGELDQVTAIVKRLDLDIGRKDVLVEFLRLGFDAFEHVLGLLTAAHHDDPFHCVVGFIEAELTQSRRTADRYLADVLHADGNAVLRADDNVANVAGVAHEADATDVVRLSALREEAAARVGVVDRKLLNNGGDGYVISVEFCRVEQHLVLHDGTAQAGVVGYSGDLLVLPVDDPVFIDFELLRGAVGTLDDVAVDQAGWARERRQGGRDAGGECDFAEALEDQLAGEVIVGTIVEREADIREAVERDRTHDLHFGHAVHFDFDRNSDETLDFFSSVTRPLGNDFDHRRRKVGVGIHRHVVERNHSTDGDEGHHEQD